MGTRRALITASTSRYLIVLLQLVASLFVAHHVLPDQFGLTVLGNGALLLATALRDLGTVGYLVQQEDLRDEQIRSALTLNLVVTVIVTAALLIAAHPIAEFYHDARLVGYMRLMACAYALGPLMNPITALLTRELAFRRIATIEVGAGLVAVVTTVSLIRLGYGFTSVAWAAIAKAATGLVIGLWFKHGSWMLRPSLRSWREVIGFGFHGSATAMVYSLGEALVYLILGKLAGVHIVGLIQRSYLITQIPERVLLAGVGAVALPTFAGIVREGRPLVPAYLNAIRLITPVYLAAMLALIVLARPLVLVLLGPQWTEAVLLIRLIAAGHLVGVGIILNLAVLVAVGGIARTTPVALFQVIVLLIAIVITAPLGPVGIASSAFVTVPLNTFASYLALRRFVPFAWGDISRAILPGALAAVCAALPALALGASDAIVARPIAWIIVSTLLGSIAWIAALKLARHPLYAEIVNLTERFRRLALSRS